MEWGSFSVRVAVTKSPVPMINRVVAAKTIRQFSRTLGCVKHDLWTFSSPEHS